MRHRALGQAPAAAEGPPHGTDCRSRRGRGGESGEGCQGGDESGGEGGRESRERGPGGAAPDRRRPAKSHAAADAGLGLAAGGDSLNGAVILVVGGAGAFGSRLVAGLAATTDLRVIVAGRDVAKAEAVARTVPDGRGRAAGRGRASR